MKKTAVILAISFAVCLILASGVFASRSDFVISADGTLTAYNGAGGDVTVPEDVTSISSGAFGSNVSSVTVLNPGCVISGGAIAAGVPIRGYPESTASQYAKANGSVFSEIYDKPTVTLRITYQYQDGSEASPQVVKDVGVYSDYDVASPSVSGYTPDLARVKGTVDDYDVSVVVTYSKNADPIPTGWKIEGNHIRFYDASVGGYIRSASRNIDGVDRSFDGDGNLIGSSSTVTVNGSTYYLLNNVICYGYVKIGDGIFYFDSDGKMVKGQTVEGKSFDSEGRMSMPGNLIELAGLTYYLDGNRLKSGFLMIGNDIYCFGDNYAMKTGVTFEGCTFDASGHLSSVNADQLECKSEETRTYNKQEQRPQVEVYLKGLKLVENVHYSVDYADNIDPGEGKIIINGIGAIIGSAELSFEIVGKATYTLTIRYQNSRGYEMHEPHTEELEGGAHYKVSSPEIEGYKPDKESVEGDIEDSDVTVIVTYSSEKEDESETDPEGTETTDESASSETGSDTERDAGSKDPDEQKTRRVYSYNFKLFFTVAGISTLVVAIAIFLIVWLNKRRKNPPVPPEDDDFDDDDDDDDD
ncbi:MAG: MucBP domain-containing protein, partial [Clostridia bacterium]|nr:MucBP domain-containing protein [Clostridia bacterium]